MPRRLGLCLWPRARWNPLRCRIASRRGLRSAAKDCGARHHVLSLKRRPRSPWSSMAKRRMQNGVVMQSDVMTVMTQVKLGQGSLNVSHAAALVLYERRRQQLVDDAGASKVKTGLHVCFFSTAWVFTCFHICCMICCVVTSFGAPDVGIDQFLRGHELDPHAVSLQRQGGRWPCPIMSRLQLVGALYMVGHIGLLVPWRSFFNEGQRSSRKTSAGTCVSLRSESVVHALLLRSACDPVVVHATVSTAACTNKSFTSNPKIRRCHVQAGSRTL